MFAHLLGTAEFWKQMCRPSFVRLSLHAGAVGRDLFFVTIPPEHVTGFFTQVVAEIENNLRLDKLENA